MCYVSTSSPQTLLWIERYYPIDTRSRRILRTLEHSGRFDIHVCAWDRGLEPSPIESKHHILHTPIGYKRLAQKALNIGGYRRFVSKVLSEISPDVVVCSFWDMAVLFSSIRHSNARAIYDVIDLPGGSPLMFNVARMLERIALRRFNKVIFSSRFFSDSYQSYSGEKTTIENLPALSELEDHECLSAQSKNIAFIGTVRHLETLIPAIDYCKRIGRTFSVYGAGPDLPKLTEKYGKSAEVSIMGQYDYTTLPVIYRDVLAVWAAYPVSEVNVRYAISNKFFESIFFSVPGVFSSSTLLGQFVAENGLGYCVDAEDPASVAETIDSIINDHDRTNLIRRNLDHYKRSNASHWRDVEPLLVNFIER